MPRLIDLDKIRPIDFPSTEMDGLDVVQYLNTLPTIDPESLRPHGRWEEYESNKDDEVHHRCSNCKKDAPFHYEYKEDYDEGLDGEWEYIGLRVIGIVESLGSFCSECGAKVDEEEK